MSSGPLIWFRKNNGNWNNDSSADPSTLTGGFNFSGAILPAPNDQMYPISLHNTGLSGDQIQTFNFGASGFVETIPSGAEAWNTFCGPTTLSPTDKGSGVTLHDDDLGFSISGEVTGQGVRGTTFIEGTSTPILYFESTIGVIPQNWTMGIGTSMVPIDGGGGGVFQDYTNVAMVCDNGTININGANPASLGIWHDGDTMCMAVILQPPLTLTGVSATGAAGTITTSITNFAEMRMTNLSGASFYLDTGDNDLNLRWSDDGGYTWSTPLIQTMGSVGAFGTSVVFQNLGYSRDRIFELSFAADGKTAIQGIFLGYEKADT